MTVELTRDGFCRRRREEWLQTILDYLRNPNDYGIPAVDLIVDGRRIKFREQRMPKFWEKQPNLNFRTMIDSWFAYHHCHRIELLVKTRTLSVQWLNKRDMEKPRIARAISALGTPHFISDAARVVLKNVGENIPSTEGLVKDHAVPVKVMEMELKDQCPSAIEDIECYLLRRYRLGIITKTGDCKFLQPKPHLRESMPDGFASDDVFARYRHPLVAIAGEFQK